MARPISFIKGHMGGNEIILLSGEEIPVGRELEVALQVLYPPNIRGHEVGLLYPLSGNNRLRARIVGGISKQFISMCGGLTQVLGKAMITTNLAQEFGLSITEPRTIITLETEAGPVLITLKLDDTGAERVVTDMTAFVEECYFLGVESLEVFGIPIMRIGKFLVANADAMYQAHPDINVEHIESKTINVLIKMQKDFNKMCCPGVSTADFSVYDLHPTRADHSGRVIFPHALSSDRIEPACGTGTVAVGLAMVEDSEIACCKNADVELLFESGGTTSQIGGPDITTLSLTLKDKKVTRATFSHSLVEIIASGQLWPQGCRGAR